MGEPSHRQREQLSVLRDSVTYSGHIVSWDGARIQSWVSSLDLGPGCDKGKGNTQNKIWILGRVKLWAPGLERWQCRISLTCLNQLPVLL